MEKKMCTKPQYKCGICGEIYESISERAQCELNCLKKQEEEAKKIAAAKKKEEQEARWAEVEMVRKHYNELYGAYMKDYEPYYNDYYNWAETIAKILGCYD